MGSDPNERLLEGYRYHFRRMWSDRHHPLTRYSLRDNLRGQRNVKERLKRERPR